MRFVRTPNINMDPVEGVQGSEVRSRDRDHSTWGIVRHFEDDVFRPAEAHEGSAHVVGVALIVVVWVSRRQIHGDVVPVVYLLFGKKITCHAERKRRSLTQ